MVVEGNIKETGGEEWWEFRVGGGMEDGGERRSWSDEKSSLSLRREYQNKGQPVKMVEAATSQNGWDSHKQIVMETSV